MILKTLTNTPGCVFSDLYNAITKNYYYFNFNIVNIKHLFYFSIKLTI